MKEDLPDDVNDWDLGTVTNILHSRYYESDYLEFKEQVRDDSDRIARTACAFANTNGGIILFGIADDRTKSIPERLVGLDTKQDNATRISNIISKIKPQLSSTSVIFRKSPFDLGKDKEILIVKIKKSEYPCQFENKFFKRITGKNDFLTVEELQIKFLESKKTSTILRSTILELSDLRESLELIQDNPLITLGEIRNIGDRNMFEFLINHSYLYGDEVQNNIYNIIEIIKKLKIQRENYLDWKKDGLDAADGFAKKEGYEDYAHKFTETTKYFAKVNLKYLKEFEKILNVKLERSTSKYSIPKTSGKQSKKKTKRMNKS